jgi:D-serine deaminase-like pyridoxal phosphate-dependent protein
VPFETALTLRNSVVSTNAKGFVTIDGGYKCFATDGPKPIVHAGAPAGARYEFFGDEHGRLIFAEDGDTIPLGAAVELMTPHCDPTVNLHDYYHVVQGDQLVDIWPIDGRGVL